MVSVKVELIPVPNEPLCDFCGVPAPHRSEYRCRDFDLPQWEYRSRGSWHACAVCEALIRQNDWSELQNRAIELFSKANPTTDKSLSVRFVADLHGAFKEHRCM